MSGDERLLGALRSARVAEREQAAFYRALAAGAEEREDADLIERFNELHADEQHHLSRLSARLLELGDALGDLPAPSVDTPPLDSWEGAARAREREEVARYRELAALAMDVTTRELVQQILWAEEHHEAQLRGKWMGA